MIVLDLLVAALDVAFVLSVLTRWRMHAALVTGSCALVALNATQYPWLPWIAYALAATYLGAVINKRVESSADVVRRPRVPRL